MTRSIADARGFTLLEATLSVAIVSVMLGAGLSAVTQAQRSRKVAERVSEARSLASMLLEEATSLSYGDPQEPGRPIGPDTNEDVQDRFTFDDVDDYDDLMLTPVTDRDALWLTDDNWVARFHVTWISTADPSISRSSDTGLKRVEVALSYHGRTILTAAAIRSAGWEKTQ
jgi:type II secretory pathway pseudopilin PulG